MMGYEKPTAKVALMEGVVRGIPRNTMRPVVDGIVAGCRLDKHPLLMPQMESVSASATSHTKGEFGGANFPQSAAHGMKSATTATPKKGKSKAMKGGVNTDLKEQQSHGLVTGMRTGFMYGK